MEATRPHEAASRNGDGKAVAGGGWFRLANDLIDSKAWASLGPAAAKVLVVLARHADRNGVCFPCRRTIAEEAGISPETVTGATRALVKAGLITRDPRKSKHGDPDSNEYRVLVLPPKSGDGAGTDTSRRRNREGIGATAERVSAVAPAKEDTYEEDPLEAHSCKRARRFVAPTVDEVLEYCRERKNAVDAEQWHAHYVANGWRVGRNAMKDWRAAVRTWERNGIRHANGNSAPRGAYTGKPLEGF